jgi:hypothetical protein
MKYYSKFNYRSTSRPVLFRTYGRLDYLAISFAPPDCLLYFGREWYTMYSDRNCLLIVSAIQSTALNPVLPDLVKRFKLQTSKNRFCCTYKIAGIDTVKFLNRLQVRFGKIQVFNKDLMQVPKVYVHIDV